MIQYGMSNVDGFVQEKVNFFFVFYSHQVFIEYIKMIKGWFGTEFLQFSFCMD